MVLRFRVDTPSGRKLVAERICPASGAGLLTKAEQRRRAAEIIAASGVNNLDQIRASVLSGTFAERAKKFLEESRTRNRKPISPSTYDGWRSCLDKWLLPNIGGTMLADVDNAVLKELVGKMVKAGLSAKSINTYVGLATNIVSSAKDARGNELYPRKWDYEFADVPVVENQRTPEFTPHQVAEMVAKADGQERMLVILAAATGLRVGELLGLSANDVVDNGTTLRIRQQAYRGRLTNRLKTSAAYREVDLHSEVATQLVNFLDGKAGLVFHTSTGRPLSQANLLHRFLYPVLKDLGIEKAGFHAFRRFRVTHLMENDVNEVLQKFWIGHAKRDITQHYSKLSKRVQYRKAEAERVGIGFTIPAIVLSVHKNEAQIQREEVVVAA